MDRETLSSVVGETLSTDDSQSLGTVPGVADDGETLDTVMAWVSMRYHRRLEFFVLGFVDGEAAGTAVNKIEVGD